MSGFDSEYFRYDIEHFFSQQNTSVSGKRSDNSWRGGELLFSSVRPVGRQTVGEHDFRVKKTIALAAHYLC